MIKFSKNKKLTTQLIIAEKPKVAQKIAYAIGNAKRHTKGKVSYFEIDAPEKKIIIAPAVGHVYTLRQKGNVGWSLEYPVFDTEWVPSHTSEKSAKFTKAYVKNLEDLGKKADLT